MERIRKVALALLFLPLVSFGQWQIGQRSFVVPPSGPATWTYVQTWTANCSAGSSCTVSPNPTIANSVVLPVVFTPDSNTISSASLTGCSSGAGTWTGGSGASYAVFNSPSPGGLIWAYNLGNSGGCNGLTVNLTNPEAGGWELAYVEFTRSSGSPTLDALATPAATSSCTTCTGSPFSSLTGTSDLIIQIANTGSGTGNPSSPYTWDVDDIVAYVLNSTATTAPTWSQSSGGFQTFGVAFK